MEQKQQQKKVCLVKCAYKDLHPEGVTAEEMSGNYRDVFGDRICNWCWGMWG